MIIVSASIKMACLVSLWFPGVAVIWILTLSTTAPPSSPFSNVVKRIKDTHSEPTKASDNTSNTPSK